VRDEEEKITRYVRRVVVVGLLLFALCVLISFALIWTDNYLGLYIFTGLFLFALLAYVFWGGWKLGMKARKGQ
jgi:hypothetical protein